MSKQTTPLGSADNPLRVAIVGSGPSGFYAAEALLDAGLEVHVDVLERLPVPFGLVRYGVAPDHPKLKTATQIFDRIAQRPGFRFLGNVTVGRDVQLEELRAHYHAVLFSSGAESDRNLGIAGEHLPGSHAATEFVGWYNGHPAYRDRRFDLSGDTAVIIGQGNVAADCARILLSPVDKLAQTDMASHAVEVLRNSRIRTVHLVGRRGPAQAKFTVQELRELGELPGVAVQLNPADLELNDASAAELQDKKNFVAIKNVDILRGWAARPGSEQARTLVVHFLESPAEITGDGKVEALRLQRNQLSGSAFSQIAVPTGESYRIDCGLVLRSVGYKGLPIAELPFDEKRCTVHNTGGRVTDRPGVYCAGWIKRGPSGIIGTNRACAVETVGALLQDLQQLPQLSDPGDLAAALRDRGIRVVDYTDWQKIDGAEIRNGQESGKPREKFTDVAAMLELLA